MNISVLGAGTWGTALAQVLADNDHSVFLWDINQKIIDKLKNERLHTHLPEFKLAESVTV